jgi:hypothetical protein
MFSYIIQSFIGRYIGKIQLIGALFSRSSTAGRFVIETIASDIAHVKAVPLKQFRQLQR